ncbi:late competence development ComFB family protein [Pontibacillus litoralis]|uniref:Late competence development protein ComFB n=1 Tax=Pontibacillus litoralis JSM 072002 TaxID=1385512 RepID=A0A0A5G6Y1_9BACI|nr:late competence development ComFB family protein [Pontibacillus litoralis]KGX86923.1 Late competence development protein ComFB [Pontibacillus litoralis JSM 072002]
MNREVTNVMEEVSISIITVLLNSADYQTFCKCTQCRNEILALSLNTLPSHYVTTEQGRRQAFELLNTTENLKWINKRIINAIHVVGKYPNHKQTLK